jgi:hypothetical protein
MSDLLQQMKQGENRLKLSMYSALNSTLVISVTLVIILAAWFITVRR